MQLDSWLCKVLIATLYSIQHRTWKVTNDVALVQLSYIAKVKELLVLLACPGALRRRLAIFPTSPLRSGSIGE